MPPISRDTLPAAFDAPDWYRALTLSERARLLEEVVVPRAPESGPPALSRDARREVADAPDGGGSDHEARAAWRLEQWRTQAPFDGDGWLAERLAADGLDEASFAALVATPAEELKARSATEPDWLVTLREAFAGAPAPDGPAPWIGETGAGTARGFVELFHPLVAAARRRLGRGLAGILSSPASTPAGGAGPLLDPVEIEPQLLESLVQRLLPIADRTLVLELNVARLQGRLDGDTPAARFRSFVARLRDPRAAIPILREYPVLARAAAEATGRWCDTSLEMLARLRDDREALRARLFGGRDPGRLVGIQGGVGDSHRGGRSVAILTFASGARVVYKPRPLAVDARFQALLAWLDARGAGPGLRTLAVLDRATHGWVEFVEAVPCRDAADVARYYRRLGGLLAVLYAIGAVDFHFENVIAAGDQPVAVDLESLLHPLPPRPESLEPDERLAARILGESVLRVGILPFRVGEGEDVPTVDLSGVAAVEGQLTPVPVLQWEAQGSDEMRAVKTRVRMPGGSNLPVLEGRAVEAAEHIDEVNAGFQETGRALSRLRDALLAPGGPLEPFADVPARAVLRPSRVYGLVLDESWHPDFLRDALDRDRVLDRLWVGLEDIPPLRRVVGDERRDLWDGDIPYFEVRPGAADVWSSRGGRHAGFFPEAPLEGVRRRIARLDGDELFRQSWLARVSLGTLLLNRQRGEWPRYEVSDPGAPAEAGELQAALVSRARELGAWFERMAVRDGGDATWVTLDLRNRVWSLFPTSDDLYSGVPGIALFLAYLADVTGDEGLALLARQAMGTVLRLVDRAGDQIPTVGLFQGWGGLVYSLAHLGSLWRDDALLGRAETMLARLEQLLPRDREQDVVAGAAGAVTSALALHAATGSARALDVARAAGEHVLAQATRRPAGLAWPPQDPRDPPRTGFAHGAAGIGCSLAGLAAATGDERFREGALAAFAFEREALWAEIERDTSGARADAAPRPHEVVLSVSWCYGAPGLGLSRLAALRHEDEPGLRAELERALAVTLERGFGRNHSLCHGDLGNLDLVCEAARFTGDRATLEAGRRLARVVLASLERDGWRCGTVAGIEAPGLMNGLAGIGYGLLRVAHPERVPSLLLMEPPRRAAVAAPPSAPAAAAPR